MPSLNDILKSRLIELMKKEEEMDLLPFEIFDDDDDFDPYFDVDVMDDDDQYYYFDIYELIDDNFNIYEADGQVLLDYIQDELDLTLTLNVLEDILLENGVDRRNLNPFRVADLHVQSKLFLESLDTINKRLDRIICRDEYFSNSFRSLNYMMRSSFHEISIDYVEFTMSLISKRCQKFYIFDDVHFESFIYNNYDKSIISKQTKNSISIRNYKYLRSLRGFLDNIISNNDDIDNG